jgi:hypothetical protein
MSSVGADGNLHSTNLNITSTDTLDGDDDDTETDDSPPTGAPTRITGHADSLQERSTWNLRETTNVGPVPGDDTTDYSDQSGGGQGAGQTGGTSSSLTETGEDDEDDENGVTSQTGSSDTVVPSDASAQQEWTAQQQALLLKYQQLLANAVGSLQSAIKARDEAANSYFTWQSTVDGLNATVAQAQHNVDLLNARIEATFGLMMTAPKMVAGDEALQWSYATKFLVSLQYAWDNNMFSGAMKAQVGELLETLQDPVALAQFLVIAELLRRGKKAACEYGYGPWANAALTVYQVAESSLAIAAIKSELDGITFSSEVVNAAPHVAKIAVEVVENVTLAALLKMLPCFVAGTQIVVARDDAALGDVVYTTRNIEDLKVGDLVLARDEFGETIQLRRVTETVKRTTDRLRVLTFESLSGIRQAIRTTPEHPFWTVNHHEFRPARRLEPGDTFISPDGELQTLTATESESHPDGIFVYNFTVEIAHTYFVSATKDDQPLLVHNSNCGTRAQKKLPALDSTGKVHGDLPHAKDLGQFDPDDLRQLQHDLNQSVQKRIRMNSRYGPSGDHGLRQGQEQDLIHAIEKYLSGS